LVSLMCASLNRLTFNSNASPDARLHSITDGVAPGHARARRDERGAQCGSHATTFPQASFAAFLICVSCTICGDFL